MVNWGVIWINKSKADKLVDYDDLVKMDEMPEFASVISIGKEMHGDNDLVVLDILSIKDDFLNYYTKPEVEEKGRFT